MEDKKKCILESAHKFFFRYGYKKTSLDEVAEDAGIGKGTIYNYFKNKEDLFISNAESVQQEMWRELNSELSNFKRADEKLLFITLHMNRHIRKIKEQYAMSQAVLEEMVLVGMDLMSDLPTHKEQIMLFLKEGLEQGIFKVGDFEKTAALLIQTIRMFVLRWATMDSQKAENEIRDLFELFFTGIRC